MRYFLYTYASRVNWDTTRRYGVFGTKKDGTGLPTKVGDLEPGDIIIIRNGSKKTLAFVGCCKVLLKPFDQDIDSPYKDYLWKDEESQHRIIYPLRVPVDCNTVLKLNLSAISWADLDALNFYNQRGNPLKGEQAWGKKLSGNFVQEPEEVFRFEQLIKAENA